MRISDAGRHHKMQGINATSRHRPVAGPSNLSPEQLLFYCTLEAAKIDIARDHTRAHDDAVAWLFAPEEGEFRPVVTLSDCCSALGWDAEAVKRAMLGV